MKFKDYFLVETFIGELASKYANLNTQDINASYQKMMQNCIEWALAYVSYDKPKLLKQRQQATKELFKWCTKYRQQAIIMLRDLHELEYKQSQLKKYYSNSNIMHETEITMMRIAKWLQLYLNVVLFSRACGDGLYPMDKEDEWIDKIEKGIEMGDEPTISQVIHNFGSLAHNISHRGEQMYNNYVTPIFVELYNARTLPQLLVAITKAKNAEHDGGKIMTEWGTGLFVKNEKTFEQISNLNYRKLDRELQQELNSI